MNAYWFRKLVRNKESKAMRDHGAKVISENLAFNDFISSLDKKIIEEATDLSRAKGIDEKINALVDLMEVLDAYRDTLAVNAEKLKEKCLLKREERGSFDNREYVEYIEVPDSSYFDNYCKRNPEKYPPKED